MSDVGSKRCDRCGCFGKHVEDRRGHVEHPSEGECIKALGQRVEEQAKTITGLMQRVLAGPPRIR